MTLHSSPTENTPRVTQEIAPPRVVGKEQTEKVPEFATPCHYGDGPMIIGSRIVVTVNIADNVNSSRWYTLMMITVIVDNNSRDSYNG